MTAHVAKNLETIRARIAAVCKESARDVGTVRLVAVSKRQRDDLVRAAYDAGHRDFGENYVQELVRRRRQLPADVRWHFIGHAQTNKTRQLADIHLVHTVDSERLSIALDRAASATARRLPVLVEVNVAEESTKAGVRATALLALVDSILELDHLELRGLMCIPPETDARRWFSALRELRDRAKSASGLALAELSMGMSGDYEDAIREGSTLVRIGTAIFGERIA